MSDKTRTIAKIIIVFLSRIFQLAISVKLLIIIACDHLDIKAKITSIIAIIYIQIINFFKSFQNNLFNLYMFWIKFLKLL